MDTIDRILDLMQERSISKADLVKLSGIPKRTAYSVLSRELETDNVKINTLKTIAEALNTTLDYIVYGKNEKKYKTTTSYIDNTKLVQNNNASLSTDEHDLISNYRKLTPNSKQIIMTLAEMELHHIKATQNGEMPIRILNTTKKSLAKNIEQSLENKPTEKAQFLKVFNQSAAAGFGDYLSDDSSFEMVSVPSIPFGTEFGIRISGDSMEPKIHDGDIAFVKRETTMNQNEIGIFIYNGDAFCKQLIYSNGKYYLHSLNAKYKDIQLYGDSFYCVGKVIL